MLFVPIKHCLTRVDTRFSPGRGWRRTEGPLSVAARAEAGLNPENGFEASVI